MTDSPRLSLAGVSPPIPTPFREDESIDFDNLQRNLERWVEAPLTSIIVGGSNGEFVSLSVGERLEVVRAARQAIPERLPLVAGSGMESTRETIALTAGMAQAGADAVIVVTPSYYTAKMDSRALEAHYRQVADASPIPVVLYSVPANTGIDLPIPTAIELAQHRNIIGMKDSGGNLVRLASLVSQTPDQFQVLAGSASFLLPALSVGAVGCISALANFAADRLVALIDAFHNGELHTAQTIQAELIPANHAVTAGFGIAGLKEAMALFGYYGGPVRSPLQPLTDAERSALTATLRAAGLI